MKKILVHVHIYYAELWPELKACLVNISPNPFDLYITMITPNPDLERDIVLFKPSAHIQIIENLGFDVGPFIHILNQVDLAAYSYVIKLHTKRNMPKGVFMNGRFGLNLSGSLWREYLLEFIKTRANFEKSLRAFAEDSTLGMCAYHFLIREKWTKYDYAFLADNQKMLEGMSLKIQYPLRYVTGTMFLARASLFIPLQKMQLNLFDFEKPDRDRPYSKAHAMERFFGNMILAQGHKIRDCFTHLDEIQKEKRSIYFQNICNFLFRKKITASGKEAVEIFCVRIYSKKIVTATDSSSQTTNK